MAEPRRGGLEIDHQRRRHPGRGRAWLLDDL